MADRLGVSDRRGARNDGGMARLFLMIFVLQVVLAIFALISCLSADEGELRSLPRFGWVLVILLFPLVGSIAYYVAGRPVDAATEPPAERPRRSRPLAPDDDPEFLRSLDKKRDDEKKAEG